MPPHQKRSSARAIAIIVGASASVAFVWWKHHLLWQSLADLGRLQWEWAVGAVAAESASMATFARMQARLVRAGGTRLHVRSAIAITYAGNAISVSLPLAGSELSVGYTYRQYLARGLSSSTAAWALTVGGVVSTLALAAVVGVAATWSGNPGLAVAGGAFAALLALLCAAAVAALRVERLGGLAERAAGAALRAVQRLIGRPAGEAGALVRKARRDLTSLRLTRRDWLLVAVLAVTNWASDAACLVCCLHGLGLHLPTSRAVLAWSGGSAAASLGLTPGGVGIVEAALVASLAAAGAHGAAATSAVFAYRLISLWSVLGIGWIVYLALQRRPTTA